MTDNDTEQQCVRPGDSRMVFAANDSVGDEDSLLMAATEGLATAVDDVTFGLDVRRGTGHTEGVDAELFAQPADVITRHARIVPS